MKTLTDVLDSAADDSEKLEEVRLRLRAAIRRVVELPEKPPAKFASALEFLESLPPGPRAFRTWEEYERHLQEEKDAWER